MNNSRSSKAILWLQVVVAPVFLGWLFARAFPPVGFRPWAFIALLGLMIVLKNLAPDNARRAGFLFGVVAYGSAVSWLWTMFGSLALALWGFLALDLMLFAWGSAEFQQRQWHPAIKVVATASLWTTIEFVRCELLPLSFPWITPGHAMDTVNSAEMLSLVGIYGVSFFMIIAASTAAQGRGAWPVMVAIFAVLMVPNELPPPSAPTISVAALQSEASSFDWFESKTRALKEKTDLVLWPEQALPFDVMKSEEGWPRLQAIAKDTGSVLVLGTQQRGQGKEWFNTALTLDASGKLGTHVKNHPVHFFNDGTPGTTTLPVTTPLGKVGTPICFDCDYQDVVRKMTLAGAEFFAVPSMDVASWTLNQHLQHAQLMRVRAAENGRWMVVATTSGITQIIDPHGRQVTTMAPMIADVMTGKVGRETTLTFYTRYGWLLPWGTMIASAVFLLAAWRSRSSQMRVEPATGLVE